MLIKKLKRIFDVEEDQELAEILSVNTPTLSEWNRKEKNKPPWPLPKNIKGLLEMIKSQQEEIQRLRCRIKEGSQNVRK